jgi:hypothetical protein
MASCPLRLIAKKLGNSSRGSLCVSSFFADPQLEQQCECIKENCAWWHKNKDCCSIVSISESLEILRIDQKRTY